MRNIYVKFTGIFLSAALFIGQLTANSPCVFEFYQPEVPTELKR